ncbi:hypothetical protein B566_EDAN014818 [Ephemera danica]|nr:hypothetical protein B566_EDAN014818 [Ephemera danica]
MMRVFKSNIHHKLLPVLFLAFLLDSCGGSCFFPAKLQGDFVMQKTAGSQVQYSKLNITTDSISIWGVCHRRIGNNVILENLMRGYRCYGCYHLNLRSKNVLQVRVRAESLDKCYTDEDNVLRTCPGEYLGSEHNPSERLKEFLLYKTNEAGGEDIRKEYCPFNGHYKFTYNLNEGSENKFECSDFTSEMDSCPSASALNLRFRKCSFVNPDITFQCLGHWAGPGSQKYLALLDTRDGGELTVRAQYRCAIYQEDTTGSIYIAFSSDSTCTSDLRNAADGFETMILNPVAALSLPDRLEDNSCRFPSWAQGLWEYIEIKNNTLIYKDHTLFETSTITCVQPDIKNPEKYVIFRRNQCGYERYTCIWMKKRALNVMEFQMGNSSSINYNGSLCDDANFPDDTAWITQGKMDVVEKTPCPIAGEYTGEIPDNTGLCAKLYSDCNKPEIMYYTIANCSEPQVYEGSRMRLPARFSRWRRQVAARNRIYHISNPRTLIRPTISPAVTPSNPFQISTPAVNAYYPAHSPLEQTWRDPQYASENVNSNPLLSDDQTFQMQAPPRDDLGIAYDPSLSSSSVNNNSTGQLQWPPRRDANIDASLAQYDNSGYTRRPVGYEASYNFQSYTSTNPPHVAGKYGADTQYESRRGQYAEYPSYVRSYQGGYPGHQRQALPTPSPTPFSEEEYDPWAFAQIHGRKAANASNPRNFDVMWNSRMEPTPIPAVPSRQIPSLSVPQIPERQIPSLSEPQIPPQILERPIPGRQMHPAMQVPALKYPAVTSAIPVVDKRIPNPEPRAAVTRNVFPIKREEREYQCLGQWEEGGLMYTYTRRKDVGSSFDFAHQFQFECFVGSITSNTDIIYIQEAGEHCQRHVDPKVHQIMKLMKRSEGGSCFGGPNQPTSNTPRLPPPHPRPTSSWYSSKRPPEPTKPWKPITAPPRDKNVRALATCCQYTLGLINNLASHRVNMNGNGSPI